MRDHRFRENLNSIPETLTFFVKKNKENFSKKENCFVRGRSSWMSFIHAQYCSIFYVLITKFNTIHFLIQKGNHIQSRIQNPVRDLRWSGF